MLSYEPQGKLTNRSSACGLPWTPLLPDSQARSCPGTGAPVWRAGGLAPSLLLTPPRPLRVSPSQALTAPGDRVPRAVSRRVPAYSASHSERPGPSSARVLRLLERLRSSPRRAARVHSSRLPPATDTLPVHGPSVLTHAQAFLTLLHQPPVSPSHPASSSVRPRTLTASVPRTVSPEGLACTRENLLTPRGPQRPLLARCRGQETDLRVKLCFGKEAAERVAFRRELAREKGGVLGTEKPEQGRAQGRQERCVGAARSGRRQGLRAVGQTWARGAQVFHARSEVPQGCRSRLGQGSTPGARGGGGFSPRGERSPAPRASHTVRTGVSSRPRASSGRVSSALRWAPGRAWAPQGSDEAPLPGCPASTLGQGARLEEHGPRVQVRRGRSRRACGGGRPASQDAGTAGTRAGQGEAPSRAPPVTSAPAGPGWGRGRGPAGRRIGQGEGEAAGGSAKGRRGLALQEVASRKRP
ncbi:PREDICTED: translation initiation factor IF-2-like, partial [Chinchilla lanigera]|uniref:translation initiation factor IF-2-like n=1 Tax=Chinchilla lanigera TaxID=34839 RepID=UPI0006971F3F